jgi:hypothetical protein
MPCNIAGIDVHKKLLTGNWSPPLMKMGAMVGLV